MPTATANFLSALQDDILDADSHLPPSPTTIALQYYYAESSSPPKQPSSPLARYSSHALAPAPDPPKAPAFIPSPFAANIPPPVAVSLNPQKSLLPPGIASLPPGVSKPDMVNLYSPESSIQGYERYSPPAPMQRRSTRKSGSRPTSPIPPSAHNQKLPAPVSPLPRSKATVFATSKDSERNSPKKMYRPILGRQQSLKTGPATDPNGWQMSGSESSSSDDEPIARDAIAAKAMRWKLKISQGPVAAPAAVSMARMRSSNSNSGGNAERNNIQTTTKVMSPKVRTPYSPEMRTQARQAFGKPVLPQAPNGGFHSMVFIRDMKNPVLVELASDTTARDVINVVKGMGKLPEGYGIGIPWGIWESVGEFHMERPVRDFESLLTIRDNWSPDKGQAGQSSFILRQTPNCSAISQLSGSKMPPSKNGWVQQEIKPGKWARRWLQLRVKSGEGASIWVCKSEKLDDAQQICTLPTADAYTLTRIYETLKSAPVPFAVKSTEPFAMFETAADYLTVFSASESDQRSWITAIQEARSCILRANTSFANQKNGGAGKPALAVAEQAAVFVPGSLLGVRVGLAVRK